MKLRSIDLNDLVGIAVVTLVVAAGGFILFGTAEAAWGGASAGCCGSCLTALLIGRIHQ